MSLKVIQGLLKIKNAQKSQKLTVAVQFSGFLVQVLRALRSEGFIRGFVVNLKDITVFLKYINGKPAFSRITLVSKPSRRLYVRKKALVNAKNTVKVGSFFFSTSQGVFMKKEMLAKGFGGEGLFFIT